MAHAQLLVAQREAMFLLGEPQIADEIEIKAVADPVAAGIERGDGRGRPAGAVARADADDMEDAGGTTEYRRIDRRVGVANGAGGALRFALGHEQGAGLERRCFRDTGRAGFGLDER